MDVSIVVTAYNYARYIDECLASCLGQNGTTLKHEVIVVDDGSTDDTPVLLARRSDPRLCVIRIDNSGIEQASNQGFRVARGRYIVRVDADDALEPDYLACMEPVLENGLDFCYPDYTIIDGDSVPKDVVSLPEYDSEEVMTRGDFLATGTIYSAELLRFLGGYANHTRNSGLENYELIIRLMAAGAKGVHVSKPLFLYRRHSINMSAVRINSIIAYGRALFQRNGLGAFRTNQYHPYKLVLPEHSP
jgi:glycosyltransferase involved in cell wall biosynthesis